MGSLHVYVQETWRDARNGTREKTLRAVSRISSQIRSDSVVPGRQCVVGIEAELSDVIRSGCSVSWVVRAIEVGIDREAGRGVGATDELENLLVAAEGLSSPVFRYPGEQAMLDRIPL